MTHPMSRESKVELAVVVGIVLVIGALVMLMVYGSIQKCARMRAVARTSTDSIIVIRECGR